SIIPKEDYNHVREINWIKTDEFPLPDSFGQFNQKALTNITDIDYKSFKGDAFYKELLKIMNISIDDINIEIKCEKYTKEDFLNEVVFLEKDYDKLVNLLKRKKNIILQGSPGVGKSFISKKLAYSIIGAKDENRVEFVQFHQNYSYEDFIQGYRPTEKGFELKYGIFYNFCMKAIHNPDKDYFFIIDEINRGNISKIFGELMMLIEEDKRGEKFGIHLTYSDEGPKFYVPENLYIIGMMNTADRSLAIIDYALRRRFVFCLISPLFDEDSDIFKEYLINNNVSSDLATKITERFKNLNKKIIEDENLGYGFRIGHSYFCGKGREAENGVFKDELWYKSIIKYEIEPLLNEYWFDELKCAEEEIDKLLSNIE
ncbi:MAG: AAA family ATPase, partial [Methanobrevibacter sp.]|nr:AAA family ATPase [Candidatus Methanoflexus mossambicus]